MEQEETFESVKINIHIDESKKHLKTKKATKKKNKKKRKIEKKMKIIHFELKRRKEQLVVCKKTFLLLFSQEICLY